MLEELASLSLQDHPGGSLAGGPSSEVLKTEDVVDLACPVVVEGLAACDVSPDAVVADRASASVGRDDGPLHLACMDHPFAGADPSAVSYPFPSHARMLPFHGPDPSSRLKSHCSDVHSCGFLLLGSEVGEVWIGDLGFGRVDLDRTRQERHVGRQVSPDDGACPPSYRECHHLRGTCASFFCHVHPPHRNCACKV